MAEGNPLEEVTDKLDDKVGGIPVWVIGLGLGLLAALAWYLYSRNRASTVEARVFDPESANPSDTGSEEESNTDFGLPDGPVGDWLKENPGSSAYPVSQNSLPITNAQWGRYVSDTFLSKGDDPALVTNAITKYLSSQGLTAAEKAVINKALALMSPPEGILPIKDYVATHTITAPTNIRAEKTNRTSIRVEWDDVPYARGYKVYVNGAFRSESISSWGTVAFLKPNTVYSISVAAISKETNKEGPKGTAQLKTAK